MRSVCFWCSPKPTSSNTFTNSENAGIVLWRRMGTSSNKPTSLLLNSLKQPECIEVWRILVWKFKNYSAKSCKILYKFSSLRIFEDLGYTPELTAGSPKHHPIEKENHLPSTSMTLGFQSLIFQGVCLRLSFYFLPCDSSPYHYRSTLATWLPGTHHSPGRESHFTLNSPTSPPKIWKPTTT